MSFAKHFHRPLLELLEDRCTPSVSQPTLDLSTRGAMGDINGAIFRQNSVQPAGCGVIDSFVRLQAEGGRNAVEQGYNTNGRLQFDEKKSDRFTHSLRVGDVPEVVINGVKYREFVLDINQKASQPYLSLDQLQIFVSRSSNLTGYNTRTHKLAGLNAVYDLDAGGDHWIKLNSRLNPGSGTADMLFLVPSDLLGTDLRANVYLFSRFGDHFGVNGGFEEWGTANIPVTPTFTNTISGTVTDNNGQPMFDVLVFFDANNDGEFQTGETFTTTDINGKYTFKNVPPGTYTVRQVVPSLYDQVGASPDPVTFAPSTNNNVVFDFVNQSYVPPPAS